MKAAVPASPPMPATREKSWLPELANCTHPPTPMVAQITPVPKFAQAVGIPQYHHGLPSAMLITLPAETNLTGSDQDPPARP